MKLKAGEACRFLAGLLIWALCFCPPVFCQESPVVLVISSPLTPYRLAAEGFIKSFGPVPIYDLSKETPKNLSRTKWVVAFGGKAALQNYPSQATIVYCLAPGVPADFSGRKKSIRISMAPRPSVLLSRILKIQPSLERLYVFWMAPGQEGYVEVLSRSAPAGKKILVRKLSNLDELPGRLREIEGEGNAIWMPPDPLLMNPNTFSIIKNFSTANDVPFYVPTPDLTDHGASAAVFIPFEEIGQMAAQAVLSGEISGEVFSEKAKIMVNPASAKQSGLTLTPEAIKKLSEEAP